MECCWCGGIGLVCVLFLIVCCVGLMIMFVCWLRFVRCLLLCCRLIVVFCWLVNGCWIIIIWLRSRFVLFSGICLRVIIVSCCVWLMVVLRVGCGCMSWCWRLFCMVMVGWMMIVLGDLLVFIRVFSC